MDFGCVLVGMDFELPSMFSRSEALASGYTDDDLRRARAEGRIRTVRRGHFVRTDVYDALDPQARHAALARAIHAESGSSVVFSHVSAAVLHGMQTWDVPLDKATFTVGRTYAGKRSRQRILHVAPTPATELTEVDGCPVTTPARTVVDLARSLPLMPAVCVGDHALRAGLTDATELGAALAGARTRTGIAKARQAVGFMTSASASVGESRSRLQLDTLPLPPPLLAQWVYDDTGVLVGKAPFLYPDHGVVGEFEGEGLHGADPALPSLDDRRRRKRMEELGWTVVRWNWQDLSSPRVLTDRVARAFVVSSAKRAPLGSFTAECR